MKTHAGPLAIRLVDEWNEHNAKIREKIAQKAQESQLEAYSYHIWEQLEVPEVTI